MTGDNVTPTMHQRQQTVHVHSPCPFLSDRAATTPAHLTPHPAGIHDTRAFVRCNSNGTFSSWQLIYTDAMKPLCDRTTDACLALLPALQFLNGTLPGPYEPCKQELRCHSTNDTAIDRLSERLPGWLANLSCADPAFDLLRTSYPQLVDYIITALSPVTSQRPSVQEWVALPELAPMVRLVQQRVAAAMPAVQRKAAALSSLRAAVGADSTPGTGWQRWKQQRAARNESVTGQQQWQRQAGRMDQLQKMLLWQMQQQQQHAEKQVQQQQQQVETQMQQQHAVVAEEAAHWAAGKQLAWQQQQRVTEAARWEKLLQQQQQKEVWQQQRQVAEAAHWERLLQQ